MKILLLSSNIIIANISKILHIEIKTYKIRLLHFQLRNIKFLHENVK